MTKMTADAGHRLCGARIGIALRDGDIATLPVADRASIAVAQDDKGGRIGGNGRRKFSLRTDWHLRPPHRVDAIVRLESGARVGGIR